MANARLGEVMGIPHDRVVLCEDGDVIELSDDGLAHVGRVPAGYVYVDGIVGDVGQGVHPRPSGARRGGRGRGRRHRRHPDRQGAHRPRHHHAGLGVRAGGGGPARRGVRSRRARRLEAALAEGVRDVEALERDVRRVAGKFVSERTRRRPMIVPVVMET